jgi:virulence factor Mce-like protein
LAVVPITVISDRYVQLFPAYESGPTMAEGDHIPGSRTTIPAELDDVLEQLDGLLAALEPRKGDAHGPLARLVRSLDVATRGRSESLAGALEGSATVLENLASSETEITGLIRNLDGLFLALANRSSEIGLVNERFALVAEALLSDQDNLEGTIENLSLLADEAAKLLNESGESLGSSFSRLANVLGTVLRHQDQLSEGIRWANVVSQALGATDAQGRGLHAYSGRQAAPGTPGAEYNYRLDSRDTIACERIEVTSEVLLAILPEATINDVMDTLLSYIPEEYDEDLAFLLRQLIPLCTSVQELPPVTLAVEAKVEAVVDLVGEERFKEMLVRWVAQGLAGGNS